MKSRTYYLKYFPVEIGGRRNEQAARNKTESRRVHSENILVACRQHGQIGGITVA